MPNPSKQKSAIQTSIPSEDAGEKSRYRILDRRTVTINEVTYGPGEVVELNENELLSWAHAVEKI